MTPGLIPAGFTDGNPREDSILTAAGRCCADQLRIYAENRQAFVAQGRPQALHDMRVALNRFREALRFFRPALTGTSASELRARITSFRRLMGGHRDLEVWLTFLESPAATEAVADPEALRADIADAQCRLAASAGRIHVLLESPESVALESAMRGLVCEELPRALVDTPSGPCVPFMARRLRRSFSKLLRGYVPTAASATGELHELRKTCKRVRYWAEFAEPALGKETTELVSRMKGLTRLLGNIQDLAIPLTREDIQARPRLRAGIRKLVRRNHRQFLARWNKVCDRTYRRSVKRALRAFETMES